jgi:hypothetical protein
MNGYTPWFRAAEHSPTRVGWYETVHTGYYMSSMYRRYWDGERWSITIRVGASDRRAEVRKRYLMDPFLLFGMNWRGLKQQRIS